METQISMSFTGAIHRNQYFRSILTVTLQLCLFL